MSATTPNEPDMDESICIGGTDQLLFSADCREDSAPFIRICGDCFVCGKESGFCITTTEVGAVIRALQFLKDKALALWPECSSRKKGARPDSEILVLPERPRTEFFLTEEGHVGIKQIADDGETSTVTFLPSDVASVIENLKAKAAEAEGRAAGLMPKPPAPLTPQRPAKK